MKIPKGGLHNINQSSQANINDSWNVLATDENNAVLIAVDKCGTKKTVGDTTEIKNSIQALEQKNIEQDNRLSDLDKTYNTEINGNPEIVSDILFKVDKNTGDNVNYREVTMWYDGSSMNDAKVDGGLYIKKDSKYYRKVIDKDGELFLEKDTMAQFRAMTDYELLLLKAGVFKGVKLNGYYSDKPKYQNPIVYYLSETTDIDDKGSVILTDNGAKFKHDFRGNIIDSRYFGLDGDDIIDHTPIIQSMLNIGGKIFLAPKIGGEYNIASNEGLEIVNSDTELFGIRGGTVLNQTVKYNISINRGNKGTSNPNDNIKNIKVHDLTLKNSTGTFVEHNHAFNANAFTDLEVYNVDFIGFQGDGFYVGSSNVGGTTERHNFGLKIHDCLFDGVNNENRNAISIIDCNGAEIFNNIIKNCTKSTMPGAIDVEPNANSFHVCQNINIYNNELYNIGGNAGVFCIYGGAGDYTTPINNINIYNNIVKKGTISNSYGVNIRTQKSAIISTVIDSNIKVYNNIFENGTIGRPYSLSYIKGIEFNGNTYYGCSNAAIIGNSDVATKIFNFSCLNENFIDCLSATQIFRIYHFDTLLIKNPIIVNSASSHLIQFSTDGTGNNFYITGLRYRKLNATATWFINSLTNFTMSGDYVIGDNIYGSLNTDIKTVSSKLPKTLLGNSNLNPSSESGDLMLYSDTTQNDLNARLRVQTFPNTSNGGWQDIPLVKIGATATKPSTPWRGALFNDSTLNTIQMWSGVAWLRMFAPSAAVANVTSANATDLATAVTLVNELKDKLNQKLTNDRASGQQAT